MAKDFSYSSGIDDSSCTADAVIYLQFFLFAVACLSGTRQHTRGCCCVLRNWQKRLYNAKDIVSLDTAQGTDRLFSEQTN